MDALAKRLLEDQRRRAEEAREFDDLYDRLLGDIDRATWREHLEARARLRSLTPDQRSELLALAERRRLGLATGADLARLADLIDPT